MTTLPTLPDSHRSTAPLPRRGQRGRRLALAGIAALAAVPAIGVGTMAGPAPAAAADVCHRWAADAARGGVWNGDGSAARPVRTLQALTDGLAPGQIGCIRNGSALDWHDEWGYTGSGIIRTSGAQGSPIVVQAEPGGVASFAGAMRVNPEVHDVVIRNIRFTGAPEQPKGTILQIQGDRIELRDNDITNPHGICINLGTMLAQTTVDNGASADDVIVDGNRVHDCGNSPTLNWTTDDSGAHGVYLVYSKRAQITNNLIYDNGWRGLQTWPRADGTLIANNLFDGNATHVNIGSAITEGWPWYSSNTVVRDNVMTNRRVDWKPAKNPASIYGNYVNGSPTYGNTASASCIDPDGTPTGGNGIAFGTNTLAKASYVDRAAKDFRLTAASACVGKGPASIQPVATPPAGQPVLTATPTTPPTTKTGSIIVHVWTVTNTGTATATTAHLHAAWGASTGTVAYASFTPSQGSCTGGECALGSLAPGRTATVTVRFAVARTGTVTSYVAPGLDAADHGVDAATATVVSGANCTKIGTAGVDSLVGTAGDDVLCGFEGDDWLYPGSGNDVVIGGMGSDTVSYSNAGAAVVVNLGQESAWDRGATTAIGWDVFTTIERAYGSRYDDILVGSPKIDVLSGYYGNDELLGYDGNDRLFGNAGNDTLNGGNGTDQCADATDARIACEA